jgi:hypothetical protein
MSNGIIFILGAMTGAFVGFLFAGILSYGKMQDAYTQGVLDARGFDENALER